MRKPQEPEFRKSLNHICRQALKEIILDPSVDISGVTVTKLSTDRFDSTKPKPCYIVTVRTNNATALRGGSDPFKGSYKERIEGILDFWIKRTDPGADAHLEILGPNSRSVDRLLPIESVIRSNRISRRSPILLTAEEYKIPYILTRGRHLIGPSPAVANVLATLIAQNGRTVERALDLYSGTGIAAKVVCRLAKPKQVIVVDSDPLKISRMKGHISDANVKFVVGDASRFPLRGRFDIVIADPYYENVLDFLGAQLDHITRCARTFLLVSGGVENLEWNRKILQTLTHHGLHTKPHIAFGQVILENTTG